MTQAVVDFLNSLLYFLNSPLYSGVNSQSSFLNFIDAVNDIITNTPALSSLSSLLPTKAIKASNNVTEYTKQIIQQYTSIVGFEDSQYSDPIAVTGFITNVTGFISNEIPTITVIPMYISLINSFSKMYELANRTTPLIPAADTAESFYSTYLNTIILDTTSPDVVSLSLLFYILDPYFSDNTGLDLTSASNISSLALNYIIRLCIERNLIQTNSVTSNYIDVIKGLILIWCYQVNNNLTSVTTIDDYIDFLNSTNLDISNSTLGIIKDLFTSCLPLSNIASYTSKTVNNKISLLIGMIMTIYDGTSATSLSFVHNGRSPFATYPTSIPKMSDIETLVGEFNSGLSLINTISTTNSTWANYLTLASTPFTEYFAYLTNTYKNANNIPSNYSYSKTELTTLLNNIIKLLITINNTVTSKSTFLDLLGINVLTLASKQLLVNNLLILKYFTTITVFTISNSQMSDLQGTFLTTFMDICNKFNAEKSTMINVLGLYFNYTSFTDFTISVSGTIKFNSTTIGTLLNGLCTTIVSYNPSITIYTNAELQSIFLTFISVGGIVEDPDPVLPGGGGAVLPGGGGAALAGGGGAALAAGADPGGF